MERGDIILAQQVQRTIPKATVNLAVTTIEGGHVETPPGIVELMVEKLFLNKHPMQESLILDPGCGEGAFIQGIIDWCVKKGLKIPRIVGVEINPTYVEIARLRFDGYPSVTIEQRDFLLPDERKFDYVVGNPPYVPITKLTEYEKRRYRAVYASATNRFDLYLLFFEKALSSLKPLGRLVLVTPEKFIYVETARPLRRILSTFDVHEVRLIDEDTFGELVTYPAITTVNRKNHSETILINRDLSKHIALLPSDGASWLSYFKDDKSIVGRYTLADICTRISAGVATGADAVFVKKTLNIKQPLKQFTYPTVAGRDLNASNGEIKSESSMLIPYDRDGRLMHLKELGALVRYLSQSRTRKQLEKRTCAKRKPWYAFHETPPLDKILKPKIFCKDITVSPRFWVDEEGRFVPRHSVYYIVPTDETKINEIADFLNSYSTRKWLEGHCQRAANGFIRIQSHILKQLPIPDNLINNN